MGTRVRGVRVAVCAVVVATVAFTQAAPALASGWSIVPTPVLNGPSEDALWGMSCSAANACTGVGDYSNRLGKEVPFAERWNGSTWATQRTPNLSGDGVLNDVSCASGTECIAVGWSYTGSSGAQVALAEVWLAGAWTVVPAAVPAGAASSVLAGVSCTSAGACVAVGHYVDSTGAQQSLAEVWNGSGWAIQVAGLGGGALSRVSCSAASACTAIGSGATGPFATRWGGSAWSLQAFATPSDPGARISMQVYGVSCGGASDCVAVGHWLGIQCNNGQPTCNCLQYPYCTIKQGALVELWNGSAWVAQSLPVGVLYGVSCVAAACTAVGWTSPGVSTVAVQSNGSGGWTTERTPGFSGAAAFSDVSCTASGACTAVGQVCPFAGACGPAGQANGVTLAEEWNGTSWTVQSTPNPPGPANPSLAGVSCVTATACTAVGTYASTSGHQVTLAEKWNGTGWGLPENAGNPAGAVTSLLAGVSCPTSIACTATGAYATTYGNPPPDFALAEGSSNGSWTLQAAQSPAADNSVLADVSCPAAGTCVAVGYYYFTTQDTALAELWNGTTWTIEPVPIPTGVSSSVLSGVSCPTTSDCMAVGSADGAMLAEQWNGTSWTIQSPAGAGGLSGVSCAAANSCVAVGSSGGVMLAQLWNGTTWTALTLPAPSGSTGSSLAAVSCPTTASCSAVGTYVNSLGTNLTLAELWNGTAWAVQATPNPQGTLGSYLSGVWCAAATTCIAVGHYEDQSRATLTLAEQYSG